MHVFRRMQTNRLSQIAAGTFDGMNLLEVPPRGRHFGPGLPSHCSPYRPVSPVRAAGCDRASCPAPIAC